MTRKKKSDLIDQINAMVNAKRVYRDIATDFVIQNNELFPILLELVFTDNSRTAIKSAWILELVCQQKPEIIKNHLDYFIDQIHKISQESALRPVAKICSLLAKSHQRENLPLTELQKEKMVASSFDWLITDHKVATQVYAMDTLFYLSKPYDWIGTELRLLLEKNILSGSAGYKAHAKKILQELGK